MVQFFAAVLIASELEMDLLVFSDICIHYLARSRLLGPGNIHKGSSGGEGSQATEGNGEPKTTRSQRNQRAKCCAAVQSEPVKALETLVPGTDCSPVFDLCRPPLRHLVSSVCGLPHHL
jgi:hypothetical protein